MNVTVGVARTNLLSNESAISDALVRINITYQHKPNQTKMIILCCFKMS